MNIRVSQQEFQKLLLELASSIDYQYKFLRHEIARAMQDKSIFYDNSLLNIQGESWILIIHSGALLVYGNNWSKNQFDELRKSFNIANFTNYLMTGDSALIKSLLEFYKIDNFRIEMERLFYRTNSVEIFSKKGFNVLLANEKDINTLAKMLQHYYNEEYEGENDKTIEEMISRVEHSIFEETMYVLKSADSNIISFCTIIDPDIGIFFTNEEFRNKGYGKVVLSYCADLLLKWNAEIYLMTVKSKAESNAACKRIGFNQYFEYSCIRINNS